MFNHHDAPEHQPQPNAEMPSATRPPQLNKTVCGCRCGRGGGRGQEDDGANNDNDAASTLVASENSDLEDSFPNSSNEPRRNATFERRERNFDAAIYREEFQTRIGLLIHGANRVHQGNGASDLLVHPYQAQLLEDDNLSVESMRNEPGSDVHSVLAPDARSEYQCPLDYHFHMRPLRLTPQYRYCRGLVASHLILREDDGFEDEPIGLQFAHPGVVNNLYHG